MESMDRIRISLGQSGNFISRAVRVQGFINCAYKKNTPKFRSGPCCYSWAECDLYMDSFESELAFSMFFSTQRDVMGFQENEMLQVVGRTTVGLT